MLENNPIYIALRGVSFYTEPFYSGFFELTRFVLSFEEVKLLVGIIGKKSMKKIMEEITNVPAPGGRKIPVGYLDDWSDIEQKGELRFLTPPADWAAGEIRKRLVNSYGLKEGKHE